MMMAADDSRLEWDAIRFIASTEWHIQYLLYYFAIERALNCHVSKYLIVVLLHYEATNRKSHRYFECSLALVC